jgi:hypothetical protein
MVMDETAFVRIDSIQTCQIPKLQQLTRQSVQVAFREELSTRLQAEEKQRSFSRITQGGGVVEVAPDEVGRGVDEQGLSSLLLSPTFRHHQCSPQELSNTFSLSNWCRSAYGPSSRDGHRLFYLTIAAMATAKQPKSILKKASYPATTSSKEDREREIALYHANLIQQRKDIELNILLSTETLIDYPLAKSPYDASNPSPADAREFKQLLRPFQPTDYDELIQERNINEKCGYTLCPRHRVKDGSGGKYRLIGTNGKAKDFKVVQKEELEKWCSEACAKRALYVRVQLSESPAWEREAAGSTVNIDLLDEPKLTDGAIVEGLENLNLHSGKEDKRQDAAGLALERGDKGLAAKTGLIDVNIQEKDIQRPAQAPSLDDLSGRLDTMHLTLEGHTPEFGSRRQRRHAEELEDEDDPDTDWKM